ncbi:hypothetical protein CBM2586_B10380 [Cupriavidus phytorum]|uniref:Uncharacterized protein n=1 Tax=Cupriavidus taiwanensis TaxID=164546 RepID=A0A975XER1_9BURK|nr:hypothetical protein CBM2586_B10380 [Cupriavidus taiwanensis]
MRISGIFAPEITFRLLLAEAGKFPPAQCPPGPAGQGGASSHAHRGATLYLNSEEKSNQISRALPLDHERRAVRQRL